MPEITNFQLRSAVEKDGPAIRRLVREGGINPTGLKWPRFVVVENRQGQVVACGQLKKHTDGSVELASLAVRRDHRSRGLARMVIEALVARHSGSMHLMCRSDLGPFYEKFGFRRLDAEELPPFFQRLKRLAALFEKLAGREMLLVMRRDPERGERAA